MEFLSSIPVDFWVTLATVVATLILGQLSKKFEFIAKKQIPLQNIFIGLVVCAVQYIITKDVNTAVIMSGVMSGGIYDLGKSIALLIKKEEE